MGHQRICVHLVYKVNSSYALNCTPERSVIIIKCEVYRCTRLENHALEVGEASTIKVCSWLILGIQMENYDFMLLINSPCGSIIVQALALRLTLTTQDCVLYRYPSYRLLECGRNDLYVISKRFPLPPVPRSPRDRMIAL